MATLDYGSLLRAGQSLVPDMREQLAQREAQDFRREQMQWAREDREAAQLKGAREQERALLFEQARDEVLISGDPRKIQDLMIRFPEYSEAIKPAWDAIDGRQRTTDLTQLGSIFARGNTGDYAGAAEIMESRVIADRAVGMADPRDEAILTALKSDDPLQQKAAIAEIGIALASVEPSKFAEVYGKLNPTDAKTQLERKVDYYRSVGRDDLADQVLENEATDIVVGQPGAPVMTKQQALQLAQGGASYPVQQSRSAPTVSATGSAIESTALAAVPGVRVTSRQRSPGHNRRVGGTPNSYHLTDQARDFVPPPGMSMPQLAAQLRQALPGFDVINEGDHVHVEPSSRQQAGAPVRVRSVQEASKLAPGTTYITPDNRTFVR